MYRQRILDSSNSSRMYGTRYLDDMHTILCLNQFNTIECAPGKRGKKNMKFSTEYIYFHQTYINIQCVVQRVNIETVRIKFIKIHYHR